MRRIFPGDPSLGLRPPRGLAHQISPVGQILVLKGETLGTGALLAPRLHTREGQRKNWALTQEA